MKFLRFYFAITLLFSAYVAYADEFSVRDSIRNQTRMALLNENFAELEKLAYDYSNPDSRTPSGAQKISLFDDGLKLAMTPPPNEGEKYCLRMEEKVREWIKAYPNSPVAHLAYARALSAHAWFFRGGGYASTVPENAWKPFYHFENLANNYLDKNKQISAADTGWYALKIGFAKTLGWDEKQFAPLIEEALNKTVHDDRIFYGVMHFLLPKWHGDANQLDNFVSRVVDRTRTQRGMELYARLYAAASQFQYQHRLFSQSEVSWPKMKEGFEDILKRYPDPWNINIYAHFSCLARDKGKTRELIGVIGTSPILLVWEPDGYDVFNSCRSWALSP